jgi:hypothetical protein
LGANIATWLAAPSSANLAAALTDESGTGAALFANEALFSPTMDFTTLGDLSVSYATQTGQSYRIGSLVVVLFVVRFTPTFTTSAGVFQMKGLPIQIGATGAYGSVRISSPTWPASRTQVLMSGAVGTNILNAIGIGSGVGATNFTVSNFTSGTEWTMQGFAIYGA